VSALKVVRCRNPESKPDSGFGSKAALNAVRCRNPESKPDSGFTSKVAVRHEGVGDSLRTFKDFVPRHHLQGFATTEDSKCAGRIMWVCDEVGVGELKKQSRPTRSTY